MSKVSKSELLVLSKAITAEIDSFGTYEETEIGKVLRHIDELYEQVGKYQNQ